VQQKGFAVLAELDVTFEGSEAKAGTHAERRQRVLRGELAGTAVRQPQGIGPWFHPGGF
jgi:hypothetical protein